MKVFAFLTDQRSFERAHMPFIRDREDLEIVTLIGLAQEKGERFTLKDLYGHNICSPASLQRRLIRLKGDGVIVQSRSQIDRRNVELVLSRAVSKLYVRYANLIRKSISKVQAPERQDGDGRASRRVHSSSTYASGG